LSRCGWPRFFARLGRTLLHAHLLLEQREVHVLHRVRIAQPPDVYRPLKLTARETSFSIRAPDHGCTSHVDRHRSGRRQDDSGAVAPAHLCLVEMLSPRHYLASESARNSGSLIRDSSCQSSKLERDCSSDAGVLLITKMDAAERPQIISGTVLGSGGPACGSINFSGDKKNFFQCQ